MSREALMLCPNCDLPGERYKSPKEVPGLGIVRRHRCNNCRRVFMSLQKVISNWAAEKILLRLEEQDEPSSEPQTNSSEQPQGMTPDSGTGTQES